MQLFCLVGSFLLTVELFYLQLTILALLLAIGVFLLTVLAFLLTVGAFFACNGKVRPIRPLRDCKQRSLTVSKKTTFGGSPLFCKAHPRQFQPPKYTLTPSKIRRGDFCVILSKNCRLEVANPQTHKHFSVGP